MVTYAHPEMLAETDWLATQLDNPTLRVVDCRYYFNQKDALAIFEQGHIPGAVHASYPTDLADPTTAPATLVPQPEQLAATLARLGISNDSIVVGYDDEGGHFASRLWWVLNYYGHDAVKILNGGLQKWQAEGRPIATGPAEPGTGHFTPGTPREAMRMRGDTLRQELGNPNLVLLDVRRESEFRGDEARAARGGRIPGARHLLWEGNLNPDKTFKSPEQIRERNEGAGVARDKEIVTYCQGGVRAAHAAFALRLIGYDQVKMYDGSWAEWGNRTDLPLEK